MGEYGFRGGIHNTPLYSKLTNGTNKLEWYITLSRQDKFGTNTRAFWALCKLLRKQSVVIKAPEPHQEADLMTLS